ncbi:hypothetical protein SAMN05444411_101469 [Lutibacter oricola]|uniref:Transcriptional regulatory protein, C terminal n=1 Tax=Lutibacter oricola TaxID=762486 RepID=A0A1H2SIX9_9FLAO|nr:hypothetical protein [Lutibacter oricola]SDW31532.1 hypothetical protein SAMN05444411_101469 [Lutibacter oricola]
MSNHLNTDKIKEYLQKICSSPEFVKSTRYTQLLKFLTEQALKNIHVKEQTIGMDLFKKNYNPIKDDGKVRVYMFNLRKKLKTYYSEIGKEDTIVFVLKKGSYDIEFTDQKTNLEQNPKTDKKTSVIQQKRNFYKPLSFALASVLAFIFIALAYQLFNTKEIYCWEPFVAKNTTNTVVLADQVIMNKPKEPNGKLYTNFEVNSATDFINFNKKHPEDSLALSNYTFFTKAIPYSLIGLTQFFSEYNTSLTPQNESELKYDVVKRGNIIYLGQPKTMSLSKEIFLKNSNIFECNPNYFTSSKNGKLTTYKPKYGDNIRMEYAMVSYFQLNSGHKALYFASNHDIGVMATVAHFTNLDLLEKFYKKLPSKDSYFNALFKVEGLNRLDTNCELVELEIIE